MSILRTYQLDISYLRIEERLSCRRRSNLLQQVLMVIRRAGLMRAEVCGKLLAAGGHRIGTAVLLYIMGGNRHAFTDKDYNITCKRLLFACGTHTRDSIP